MGTASLYEHYEHYVREYRSVLHLIDQMLASRGTDPAGAVQARRHLLGEDAVAAFIHITERMQAEVSQGRLEVDVVLAALVYDCCDKLTLLGEDDAVEHAAGPGRGERKQHLLSPARRLFHGACRRLLHRSE
jgi:hypothetical protein